MRVITSMSSNSEKNEENNEEVSEGSSSDSNDANRPPGFSFTKSAIADLPSTAVQSIHIENETPIEVDDDVFVWRDVTASGTKLAAKAKFKKVDLNKNKGPPASGKTKDTGGGVASTKGSKVITKPSTLKSNSKVVKAAAGSGHGPVKAVSSVPKVPNTGSKNRIKERRPSVTSAQGKANARVGNPVLKKVSSLGKVAGGSKTKLLKLREKRANADHGKHGRSKQ